MKFTKLEKNVKFAMTINGVNYLSLSYSKIGRQLAAGSEKEEMLVIRKDGYH